MVRLHDLEPFETVHGYARVSTTDQDLVEQERLYPMTISETARAPRTEGSYLGFLFRCYSDPKAAGRLISKIFLSHSFANIRV